MFKAESTMPGGRSIHLLAVLLLIAGLALTTPAEAQGQAPSDVLQLAKTSEELSNAEIAIAMSQAAFGTESGSVVIARDDAYADALASGILQQHGPLLYVPTTGPLPATVREEIQRLSPRVAYVLGGSNAVSDTVVNELSSLVGTVSRREGPTRLETAIAIADAHASGATTAILARAFPSPTAGDPSQGFADSLAAGGLAAEAQWPILLTESDQLSTATAEYLAQSRVEHIVVLGGDAAIADEVLEELQSLGITVERVSGASRFDTAANVADVFAGETDAGQASAATLVEGTSGTAWLGGFAAASVASHYDAPVLLTTPDAIPTPTSDFVNDRVDAGGDGIALACITSPALCADASADVRRFLANDRPVEFDCSSAYYDDGTGSLDINGNTLHQAVWASRDSSGDKNGPCRFGFDLGRSWTSLSATFGITDDSTSSFRCAAEVFVDGDPLYRQEAGLGVTHPVEVDLSGALRVELLYTFLGSGPGTCALAEVRASGHVQVDPDVPLGPVEASIMYLSEQPRVAHDCTSVYYDDGTGPLSINGSTHLRTHWASRDRPGDASRTGPCWFEFDLGREWDRLEATFGVGDESASTFSCSVEVIVDGAPVHRQSGALGQDFPVALDITDALRVRLEYTFAGEGPGVCGLGDVRALR